MVLGVVFVLHLLQLNTCMFVSLAQPAQDHIGAARFVYDHFTEDDHSPTIIASRRITQDLNTKDRRDPDTVFGAVFGTKERTMFSE